MSASHATTAEAIRSALAVLQPDWLTVQDDSAAHRGHPGARDGGGHYHVAMLSARFTGLTAVARHRMVYTALGTLMGHSIHALAIQAWAPGEGADAERPRNTTPAKED